MMTDDERNLLQALADSPPDGLTCPESSGELLRPLEEEGYINFTTDEWAGEMVFLVKITTWGLEALMRYGGEDAQGLEAPEAGDD
jgi:hypothetical protein